MTTEVEPSPPITQTETTSLTDGQLAGLFGTDLEFLHQSGSLSIFYYDPETGYDGLEHTLIGDADGGFHCEAAAQILGKNHPSQQEKTLVDRDSPVGESSRDRREYTERPFEPFSARVVIGGVRKLKAIQPDSRGFQAEVRNSMYPSEYDPVAVVRTINVAYRNMDRSQDRPVMTRDGVEMILNDTGSAPMLDGKTEMRIRMIMDPVSRKVVSAHPVVQRGGYMNLSQDDINRHLFESPVESKTDI